ncbi:hypothetical protein J4Q44_G00002710 [Coregonus suidteri]|uniref:Uncharacterized protein n=1 Tax=Coregonus suidteri TaxID=861788 RepID=A0AAN8R8P4_9TELE
MNRNLYSTNWEYTMDITVLDAIRNIELKSPLIFQVFQKQQSCCSCGWKESTVWTSVPANDISKLQTSYSIFVRRDPSINLLFTLTCAGIILAILAFITVIACRTKNGHNNKSPISKSSNATYSSMDMELQPQQDIPGITSDIYVSRPKKGEVQPLLQHGTRSVAYSCRI